MEGVMNEKIGDLNWEACKTCKHGERPEGGCDIEDQLTYCLDFSTDAVICDDYDEKGGDP